MWTKGLSPSDGRAIMPSASRNESQRSGEATQGGRETGSSGERTRQRAGSARRDSAGRLMGNQRPARPETWIKALARPLFREAFLFAPEASYSLLLAPGPTECSFVDRVEKRLAAFSRLRHTRASFSIRVVATQDKGTRRSFGATRGSGPQAWRPEECGAGSGSYSFAPAHPPRVGAIATGDRAATRFCPHSLCRRRPPPASVHSRTMPVC